MAGVFLSSIFNIFSVNLLKKINPIISKNKDIKNVAKFKQKVGD